jgi:exodeoxyribonuclease V alpha subunit
VTTLEERSERDPFDVRLAREAPGVLRPFNDAGVLSAADVHVARRLATLAHEDRDDVLLAAALAARAPRVGHVCTDLATVRQTATADIEDPVDLCVLPWPAADEWLEQLAASPLVAEADDPADDRPLRLDGTRLYVDRYWRQERQIAADLTNRSEGAVEAIDLGVLRAGLDRLFDGEVPDLQRLAGAVAVLHRFAVVAGGPGTGKTTTVARILVLLDEQARAAGRTLPRVALAAPTGKAAARLEEAVHAEAAHLDVPAEARDRLLGLRASTLHRLLGWRPGSRSRFRHHRGNRLPHEVVIVDETSMVSLSLMAKLVEAVRSTAHLVLVGDHEQLASVEAGAVLGDIVGPARDGLRMSAQTRGLLADVTGHDVPAQDPPGETAVGDAIVVLRRVHRFRGGIAELARAVQAGDPEAALAVLGAGHDDVHWIEADVADSRAMALLAPVRLAVVAAGRQVAEAARAGDAQAALSGLGAIRMLCAHRRGPYGAATWMTHVEGWLTAAIDGYATGGRWYLGRPLLVTENDYGLRLYNGDTGVVVAKDAERVTAVFERGGELLEVRPSRLSSVDTVHAMTVHKSQGSQFDQVAILLPSEESPILTRELFYTAVTRARSRLWVVATQSSLRAAICRPIARASGLRNRLWDPAERA